VLRFDDSDHGVVVGGLCIRFDLNAVFTNEAIERLQFLDRVEMKCSEVTFFHTERPLASCPMHVTILYKVQV